MQLTQDQTQIIKALVLQAINNVQGIFIFGSYATNQATEQSDIDIAILAETPIKCETLIELQFQLSTQLKKSIDLVDLHQISTIFRQEILTNPITLFGANTLEVELFATHALADYVEFINLRKPLLDDIKKRGSIYG